MLDSPFVTVIFGVIAFGIALNRPSRGIALALVMLYFPLLRNLELGPIDFSLQMFPLLGLTLKSFDRNLRLEPLRFWQRMILIILGGGFLLSFLFSESVSYSVRFAPNLAVYLLWLFVMMKFIRTDADLWGVAKLILVLGFLFSIWRIELRPIRVLLDLPSMGFNGAVFNFHPAVAIALVVAIILPRGDWVTLRWKIFAWLTLLSCIYHGFLLETRSAWLAWMAMAAMLGLRAPGWKKFVLIFGASLLASVIFLVFGESITANLNQTRISLEVASGEISISEINSDDLIRLVARDAGLRMFYARPIFGWGPNTYIRLKPQFLTYFGKASELPGAFNAWLIALAEWGLVGTTGAMLVFFFPLGASWFYLNKNPTLISYLALAFALAVLGMGIHLLFIDLMYSLVWAHLGLALAAARLALDGQTHD